MCKAQMTTGLPWLVVLVLLRSPAGAETQELRYPGPIGHGSDTRLVPASPAAGGAAGVAGLAWGPIGHSNNERPVPALGAPGWSDEGVVRAVSAPIGHRNNEHGVPALNGFEMQDAILAWSDLLGPQTPGAPPIGGPGASAVPAPGAAALLALAALGARRRRGRG